MTMELKETCVDDPQTTQDKQVHSGNRLRKLVLMEMEDGRISPSKVAQEHICAPSNNRYPVSNAFELFDKATSYGFGNIIDVPTPSKRVKKIRKTPCDSFASLHRNTPLSKNHKRGISGNISQNFLH